MEVFVFGVDFINKTVEVAVNPLPNEVNLSFDITHREHDAIITIKVEQKGYVGDTNLNYTISSTTGFHIVDDDLDYLKHPLNAQTVDLCVELSQTAIAHNRVLALSRNDNNTVGIKIKFYKRTSELIEIVRHALSATLN